MLYRERDTDREVDIAILRCGDFRLDVLERHLWGSLAQTGAIPHGRVRDMPIYGGAECLVHEGDQVRGFFLNQFKIDGDKGVDVIIIVGHDKCKNQPAKHGNDVATHRADVILACTMVKEHLAARHMHPAIYGFVAPVNGHTMVELLKVYDQPAIVQRRQPAAASVA